MADDRQEQDCEWQKYKRNALGEKWNYGNKAFGQMKLNVSLQMSGRVI